jgi:hypothetical protein
MEKISTRKAENNEKSGVRNKEFFRKEFGRIFCGAKRRKKPGFPLQFRKPACGGLAGFPLQSLAHGVITHLRKAHSLNCVWIPGGKDG